MNRKILLFGIIACVLILAGYFSYPALMNFQNMNEKAIQCTGLSPVNGQIIVNDSFTHGTVCLPLNSSFTLQLKENQRLPYRWVIQPSAGLLVTNESFASEEISRDFFSIRMLEMRIWNFSVTKPGMQKITGTDSVRQYDLTIFVS